MPSASAPPPASRRSVTPPRISGPRTTVDVEALYRDLADAIEGEVRFDRAALGLYASDASNFRQVPIGVVIPRTVDDVVATHAACRTHGAPVTSRGAGTSLSGEAVNVAVIVDHSKYLRAIGPVDVDDRSITAQAGAINDAVNAAAAPHGLTFGPDPSTRAYCTIGGNVGNNSCGVHSVLSQFHGPGPRTSDNVRALDVVTYAGERFTVGVDEEDELDAIVAAGGERGRIYRDLRDLRDRYGDLVRERYPTVERLPRRVSGYNLDELLPERGFNVARALAGTEGTCVTTVGVTVELCPSLPERSLVVVAFDDICDAGDLVGDVMGAFRPIGVEAFDHVLVADPHVRRVHRRGLELLPGGSDGAWLLVQFGADAADDATAQSEGFADWLRTRGVGDDRLLVRHEGDDTRELWRARAGGVGAASFPADGGDHWPGWEDSAVPVEAVGDYLRDLRQLYARHGVTGAMYGHLGQGCVHSRISFDLRSDEGVRHYRAFVEDAADLVVSYGGSLSGEHGDGQQRAELLVKQYGRELVDAMVEFKRIWDPDGRMNPGKVVAPYRLDEHLRVPAVSGRPRPDVRFAYPSDDGDLRHAAIRCVGIGRCRDPEGATVMCPSYVVTQEEMHTTRGRARLLFEMLAGDVVTDGWQSEEVHAALDLCLSCKGCTNDCPVNVDMPTYKAEFLHHHYRSWRRWRPLHAYVFGFIDQLARLAVLAPEVTNALTHAPVIGDLVKSAAGVHPERQLPSFAPMTLQRWFRGRGGTANPDGPRVVLWPDTFSNHIDTEVGVACVETLEAVGWQVVVPQHHVCCGRPFYDHGFLDAAERSLRRVVAELRGEIRAGTPVVGIEPSCVAVFKDELPRLLPDDADAVRLSQQTYHLAEFLDAHDVELPRLEGDALVWGHCHHRATGGLEPELRLLERMGLSVEELRGGCCGLAGSWGFEEDKYELSIACGEQALLPAVRDAAPATRVVADGFSCRTQLDHALGGERRGEHLGQLIALARGGPAGPPRSVARPAPSLAVRVTRSVAAVAVVGLSTVALRTAVRRLASR